MANKSLFASKTARLPRADAVNEAGGRAYKLEPKYALAQVAATGNRPVAVNRESPRDFAILDGVGIRKRAIPDADLAGRDAWIALAVNKKPAKTRDLTQKSRDSRLGFLCLPD